jgi:hypothetical protein
VFEELALTIGFTLILLIYFAARAFQHRFRRVIVSENLTVVEYVVMLAIFVMVCLRTKWRTTWAAREVSVASILSR